MLNPAVKVKSNSVIEGVGLVASQLIPKGDIVFRFDDSKPPAHLYEIVNWPPQKRIRFLAFAIQIGEDDFSFQQGDIKYINHSCDPTVWWDGYGTLTARRDIRVGEEITYDYSTSDITLIYKMQCLCGTKSCRGTVTNKDYLNPAFQDKYINHLPKHVLDAINNLESNESGARTEKTGPVPQQIITAARQTRLDAPQFKARHGKQYIYEMVKHAIEQAVTSDPELRRNYGDRYIFESTREIILNG